MEDEEGVEEDEESEEDEEGERWLRHPERHPEGRAGRSKGGRVGLKTNGLWHGKR